MCRSNFNGYWELAFLPYEGGLYDQPAPEMERILLIKDCINAAIQKKKEEEKD